MPTGEAPISNVSDTARWVAAYRARESARPDALFDDPLAEELAGSQGYAIADAAPWIMRNGWPIVTRTKLIDDLIATSIAEGCDRVLNLAAGLDTRPYRSTLPADFVWVEADLPAIVAEKERALAGHTPRCALHRFAVDLAEPTQRRRFLDTALGALGPSATPSTKALVLTEGLLVYLDSATVIEIARDLDRAEIAWWLMEVGVSMRKVPGRSIFENAPLRFEPANGVAFFEDLGWRAREIEPVLVHARKFGRAPWFLRPLSYLPQRDPRAAGRRPWLGVVRFERG